MKRRLTKAEINHLRRLLGWVACEVGQSPEELVATVQKISGSIQDVDDAGKARLIETHAKAAAVPKYVRAAVLALRKAIVTDVITVDSDPIAPRPQLPTEQKMIGLG